VSEQAYRMGVAPDRLAQQLSDNGQLPALAGDVLRSNALRLLAERARIVDEAGRPVYVSADEPETADEDDDIEAEDEDADES
jgi:trigger factor